MDFKEVQDSFFEYEDKRHTILQETQFYYLQRGFQPYTWFDEEHRLRVKNKYRRGIENFVLNDSNKERNEFLTITKNFSEQNNIKIRFIHDFCETDTTLPEDVQSQWSTEIILEV